MAGLRPVFSSCLMLIALLVTADLAAQSRPRPRPMGIGPEVRVDTLSGDSLPSCPATAVAPNRSFQMLWYYAESTPYSVYTRHFAPSGMPTDPTQVEIGPAGTASNFPAAYALSAVPNGFQAITARIDRLITFKFFLRQLNTSGKPVSALIPVSENGAYWAWSGPGSAIYLGSYQVSSKLLIVQRLRANGKPAGPPITVNSRPIEDSRLELAPFGGDGDFVAVWNGVSVEPNPRQVIRGRVFRHNQPQGADFDINVTPGVPPRDFPYINGELVVAMNPLTHGFTVLWAKQDSGFTGTIQGRSFDAQGRPSIPERLVSTDFSTFISLAYDDAGNLLVLWNLFSTSRSKVLGRLFRSDLTPVGVPFEPWSEASGNLNEPICAIAVWAGDSWRIGWMAENSKNGPRAVFTRRFTRGTPGS
jgi:hypothetical protein